MTDTGRFVSASLSLQCAPEVSRLSSNSTKKPKATLSELLFHVFVLCSIRVCTYRGSMSAAAQATPSHAAALLEQLRQQASLERIQVSEASRE